MQGLRRMLAAVSKERMVPGDIFVLTAGLALLAAMMLLDAAPGSRPIPDFASMSVEDKKREFFAYLSPMISRVNFAMAADRDRVTALREAHARGEEPGWFDRRWLRQVAVRLEVPMDEMELGDALETLERRAGVVPESIVLVQAAVESGWGTSRFAREGNNFFGQRCYRADCGMQPLERPQGRRFGLAKFASVFASLESYMLNLNTHPEYRPFREIRERLRDRGEPINGLALVAGLAGYSERGEDYVAEIAAMIRANDLE